LVLGVVAVVAVLFVVGVELLLVLIFVGGWGTVPLGEGRVAGRGETRIFLASAACFNLS